MVIIALAACLSFTGMYFICPMKVESPAYQLALKVLLKNPVAILSIKEWEKEEADFKGLLLDARDLIEYETSHLKGAKWIGFKEFENQDWINSVHKNEDIGTEEISSKMGRNTIF